MRSDQERAVAPRSPGPLERRAWPRFTALDPRGWVGWWAGGDFHETEARVLDVGEFGAAVEVDRHLPRDCPLFLSLNVSSATESIEAEVVATQPGRKRKHLFRLAFASRCPDRLLSAIIHGPTAPPADRAAESPAPASPGEHQGVGASPPLRGERPGSF